MNLSLLDPFQGDFPEIIDGCLDYGTAKCIAFNRRGTLLASGCAKGVCVIWDLDTRGVANVLKDQKSTATITSVSWSKNGKLLCSSSADHHVSLWDVCNGTRIKMLHLDVTILYARLCPCLDSLLCLVCCARNPPLLVDFHDDRQMVLPIDLSQNEASNFPVTNSQNSNQNRNSRAIESSLSSSCIAITFNKSGDLVYAGGLQGEILIISVADCKILSSIQVPGSTLGLRQLVFSRNGRYLLANCQDRVLRVFENLLPIKEAEKAAIEILAKEKETLSDSVKSAPSSDPFLKFLLDYYDGVNRFMWRTASFNGDGEYVIASAASKGEHKIYVWNRSFGQLARILEGPKDAVIDLTWHPTRSLVASVGHSGRIYLWCKVYVENWNAFAPDYKELEDNEEYVEREDEFDDMTEGEEVENKEDEINENSEAKKKDKQEKDADDQKSLKQDDENEVIDIETVEKIAAYSDSDDSQIGLHFLPVIPEPDTSSNFLSTVPSSSSKLITLEPHLGNSNSKHLKLSSASNHKRESQNLANDFDSESEHANYAKMFLPDDQTNSDNSNGRGKRKRKISEKALEFQLDFYRGSTKSLMKIFDSNEGNSNSKLKNSEEEEDRKDHSSTILNAMNGHDKTSHGSQKESVDAADMEQFVDID